VKVSYSTGRTWDRETDESEVVLRAAATLPRTSGKGVVADALQDFALWRRRYLGRVSSPWQEEAAYRVVELLASPEREFLVVNCPPGSGKSTLFSHDIPAWLICRNRAVRILIGSRTERQARQYTGRIRRTLERQTPLVGEPELVEKGAALDAEATLATDYGTFRPTVRELWRIEEFIVAQPDDVLLEDKEPTVSAFGMDSGFLGGRYDYVIWDDLVDKCLTPDAPVSMADGTRLPAGEIRVGHQIEGRTGPTRVVAVEDNGVQPTFEVRTRAGRSFRATANHPIYTPRGWVDADRAQGHGCRIIEPEGCELMDRDAARMLGYMVGDGALTSGNCRLTASDPGIVDDALRIAKKYEWGVRQQGERDYSFSNGAREFFREHGILGLGSHDKHVPETVMRASGASVAAFLSGYFDADGSIDKRRSFGLSYVSVSHQLLVDVQALLARFGIESKLSRRSGGDREAFYLRIPASMAGRVTRVLSPVSEKAALLKRHHDAAPVNFDVTDVIESVEATGEEPTVAIQTEDETITVAGILTHNTTMRTAEARESQRRWWDDEATSRVEPGGVCVLQGQRMGPDDLYHHALSQVDVDDEGEPTGEKMYKHVVYKAHYDELCSGRHEKNKVAPYPHGCLLDPYRLPWRTLTQIRTNRNEKFRVLYQQEDVDPANVLCPPSWWKGGAGEGGEQHPGCEDLDRGLCELPNGLDGRLLSLATADPSPTKYWAVQWWVVRVDSDGEIQQRYLMDLLKETMDAPAFLDWHDATRTFSGVMEDWQQRSAELGYPITHWIVEKNAAQRFLLQYEHVRRWQSQHAVSIIGHETTRWKADPAFGPQILGPLYRYGKIRVPMKGPQTRITMLKLYDEVTMWPESRYDDQVMAQWFLEWNLPHIVESKPTTLRLARPSWMKREKVAV